MKPLRPHTLACGALLALCSSSFAFEPVQFIAKSGTPESQQWTKDGSLEPTSDTLNERTVLDVDDGDPAASVVFRRDIDESAANEAAEAGFVLEVTGRIEPTSGPSSQRVELGLPAARVVLSLNSINDTQWVGVITPENGKPIMTQSPDSDFHVWKVVGKPTDDGRIMLSYYCDGNLVAGNFSPLQGSKPNLVFGASGGNIADRVGRVLYEKVVFRPLEEGD